MQVLHTHWLMARSPGDEGGLFGWAETADPPQPTRDRRKKSAQPHPFTLNHDALASLVRRTITWRDIKPDPHSLTLWLPTNKFGPIPAPELRPWIVVGVRLKPGALRWLLQTARSWPQSWSGRTRILTWR